MMVYGYFVLGKACDMRRSNLKWIGLLILTFFITSGISLMAQTSGKTQSQTSGSKQILKGKTVNINKVTAEDLVKNVPLITPELAKKIVQYRKDNGDFQTLEELLQVEGFNRELLRRIKTFLLLEGVGGKDCTC
jgi:competence ComEA-like helix-hairpin-helix protein